MPRIGVELVLSTSPARGSARRRATHGTRCSSCRRRRRRRSRRRARERCCRRRSRRAGSPMPRSRRAGAERARSGGCARLSPRRRRQGGPIKHDVSVPVVARRRFHRRSRQRGLRARLPRRLRVCAFGHFGDGNIHFNLSQPVGMDKAAFCRRWKRASARMSTTSCASWAVRSGRARHRPAQARRTLRYKDPVDLDLMRTLKRALDPHGIT